MPSIHRWQAGYHLGISNIFPIADLWAQFSPFELDTEEKPGADAVRALHDPASGLEWDIVVADRGTNRIDPEPIAGVTEFPFSI